MLRPKRSCLLPRGGFETEGRRHVLGSLLLAVMVGVGSPLVALRTTTATLPIYTTVCILAEGWPSRC